MLWDVGHKNESDWSDNAGIGSSSGNCVLDEVDTEEERCSPKEFEEKRKGFARDPKSKTADRLSGKRGWL